MRMLTIEFSAHANGRQRKIERLSPNVCTPTHFCGSGDL
jgi:hypothetical protein